METNVLLVTGLAAVIIVLVILVTDNDKRKVEVKRLYQVYQQALVSGNKAEALKAGRDYYGYMRKDPLTVYDEQAINNDLSAMTH